MDKVTKNKSGLELVTMQETRYFERELSKSLKKLTLFLDLRLTEGPIKSPLSVCLSICSSFSLTFFSEMTQ